ncbi:hypothetical protein N865_16430 [Intrasporangium oryzae NRRL B-24470]|uniref:Uncharacterized protein n=1 Tax=Intrasporangium oryzae NRRL B-24470 TaxID=1386089 RepID=W9G2C5_9MICO|nr:hypothetical protein [Intrasporangium oryzae]EWT00271.1 hypothetical protein N865_16430 [Intrasporangium oryzae NRRL B-24470]
MADPQQSSGAGQRFVINVVGLVGLVFGVIPILRYLLGFDFFGFTTAPYDWLRLEGAARFLPPVLVLVVCIAVSYWLERRLQRD